MKRLRVIFWRIESIGNFFRRAWIYREWLAYDQDWDWSYLADIMERKLRRMDDALTNGFPVDSRAGRECRIAAHLLKRLREDDYDLNAMMNKVPQHDQVLLGKLIGKKLRHWWS